MEIRFKNNYTRTKELIKEILLMSEREVQDIVRSCAFSIKEKEALKSINTTAITDKLSEIKSKSFREYAISSFIEMYADFESSVLSLIENKDKRYSHSDKIILKDIRIVFNSIDKSINKLKKAGITAESERREDLDGYFMTIEVKKP